MPRHWRGDYNLVQITPFYLWITRLDDTHNECVYFLNMKGGQSTAHRRINITLPENTVRLMDRMTAKGDRSRLIAEAVQQYLRETTRTQVRKRLQEGAVRRAERDLQLAREWFFVDKKAYPVGNSEKI